MQINDGSKVTMFGVSFCACSLPAAVNVIISMAKERRKEIVITPNVDHIVTMKLDEKVASIYKSARIVFADGMPLVWLSRLLPTAPLPARVTGADLLPLILREADVNNLRVGFLGGAPDVSESAVQKMKSLHASAVVCGAYSPPQGFEFDEMENHKILKMVNEWQADILVLALGAPKQEVWAARFYSQLECGPILCFGAALDFWVGKVLRAPVLLRRLGFEWLWRLAIEPSRMWRRYLLKDFAFFRYAAVEVFSQWKIYFNK